METFTELNLFFKIITIAGITMILFTLFACALFIFEVFIMKNKNISEYNNFEDKMRDLVIMNAVYIETIDEAIQVINDLKKLINIDYAGNLKLINRIDELNEKYLNLKR